VFLREFNELRKLEVGIKILRPTLSIFSKNLICSNLSIIFTFCFFLFSNLSFNEAEDRAAKFCPSAECWTFDDNTQKCLLKDGCVSVDCKKDRMDISAKPAVLGGAVQFAKVPGWTRTVGRVAKIALHEYDLVFQHQIFLIVLIKKIR